MHLSGDRADRAPFPIVMAKPSLRKFRRSTGAPVEDREGIFSVAHPIVVTVDGKKGIFISLEAANLTRDQPVEELARTIDSLQAVLAEKEREILGLKERIAELLTLPQSPADFSAALQSTVDSLQTELSHLSNPIANFAVKEFKFETLVGVTVTPLGTVEYRFAGPGERINPESQSRLSLTLVPVEKEAQSSKDLDRFLSPLRPIGQIPDLAKKTIGKDSSAQGYFERNHVFTIGELVRVGGRANLQARIAAALQVDSKTLARWLDIAELLLIKDLDYALAMELQAVGINGMEGLRKADADRVVAKLKREYIDVERFQLWQAIAERYLESR